MGCGSHRSLLPSLPLPAHGNAFVLHFTYLTWQTGKAAVGLGRGLCPLWSTALLEAAFLPEQELFTSLGRAQRCQVESRRKGKRKMQELFLHVVSGGNILLPFLSQKHVFLELVDIVWVVLTTEYYLDQTPDKLKPECVWLLIFSCISLEEDYFAAPVLIRCVRQVSLLILFSLGELNLLLGWMGAAQLT